MEQRKQIDLKKRIKERNIHSTDGVVSFAAQTLNDKNLDELAVISEMLDKVGITLKIERYENAGIGSGFDFVTLKVNEERYKESVTRNAGRKPNFAEKYDKYGECTVKELQEKLKTVPKTKIAKELGCQRMTLYRILKNISERNPEGDMSIWHFTA